MNNIEILENVVNEYPFQFHELKYRPHEERNETYLFGDEKYLDILFILNKNKFKPHLWNLQKANGLKPAAEYTVKSPLGEILYFKIVFQTLLYDVV